MGVPANVAGAWPVFVQGMVLGRGARWLATWFAKPCAWQVLEALIGLTKWVLPLSLVRQVANRLWPL